MSVWFEAGLVLVFAVIAVAFAVLGRFAYRMAVIVMDVEDAIEHTMDVLDQHYTSLSKILEKPVFFDSMEIRQAIDDIAKAREAVLYVANELTKAVDPKAVEQEKLGND